MPAVTFNELTKWARIGYVFPKTIVPTPLVTLLALRSTRLKESVA